MKLLCLQQRCLFDKTGTISTDIVVADRVVSPMNYKVINDMTPSISENIEKDIKSDIIDFMVNKGCPLESNNSLDMSFKGDTWSAEEWNLSSSPLGLQIVAACCHSLMELLPYKDARCVSYFSICHFSWIIESKIDRFVDPTVWRRNVNITDW